jgi:hypothetical protein
MYIDVSRHRRIKTIELALAALAMNVPGDIVETGTHTGGTATLLMKVLLSYDQDRLFWGCDSFEGLPEAGPGDHAAQSNFTFSNTTLMNKGAVAVRKGSYRASEEQFLGTLREHHVYDPTRLRVLKGWFSDTLPNSTIGPISFLRLDGDVYASTRDAIEALYDRLSPGGFVYVDDYGSFMGCRNAIEEFREKRGIVAEMHAIMENGSQLFEGIWWQKPLQ